MKRIRGDRVVWTDEMRRSLSDKYTGEGNPMYGKEGPWKGRKRPEITGDRHPNYKGGWVQDGYEYVLTGGRQVAKHRHMMEEHLGRRLDPHNEVVHHINGDRLDNRIENLKLMTRAEHMNVHREDLLKREL